MKVLNISRFLPIKGFPKDNDITFKIYYDLAVNYGIQNHFIMPVAFIPKVLTFIKKSLKTRFRIINNENYTDKDYNIFVSFYQSYLPMFLWKLAPKLFFLNLTYQFTFFRGRLVQLFVSVKPNIIHAHTIYDGIYAYWLYKRFQVPYLITLRGNYSNIYETAKSKEILASARHIITPSYQLYNRFKDKWPIDLVPHGIDTIWYSEKEKIFDPSIIKLVTVSRLLEMKNIQIVLEAIKQLIEEGYLIEYDIVGDGPFRQELQQIVNRLELRDYVRFHGFLDVEGILRVYVNKDIFIMLSRSETFGRSYFEAAAQGLLVIGTKGTGADGYLSEDEGIFIEPTKFNIVTSLKNLRPSNFATFTQKSKKRVKSFRNEQIVKKYKNLLSELL